jgi:hypothetical protein
MIESEDPNGLPVFPEISLFNCKNVIVEVHQPSAIRRRRDRHGSHQRYLFKTLRVTSMSRIVLKEVKEDSDYLT